MAAALRSVPGVADCRVCFCSACRKGASCPFEHEEGEELFLVETASQRYGAIAMDISDEVAFSPYAPFVADLANSVALILENRAQNASLQAAIAELGERERLLSEQAEAPSKAENDYRVLFNEMTAAFASHEIILDENGKPVDYVFLQVNPAFERLTGLSADEVVGKRVLDVIPDIEPWWIEVYGRVALTGEEVQFESNSAALGRTYEVVAYRPQPGQFATVFSDVTDRTRAQADLEKSERRAALLARVAGRLLGSDDPQEVVEDLCRQVMDELHCDIFLNFLAVPEVGRLRLNAYAGIPEEEGKAFEWLDYGVGVCGGAARDEPRIVAENTSASDDPLRDLVKSYGIQAYACHSLVGAEGLIGTLSFGTRSRKSFSDEDLALMKAVADHVALAIQRKRAAEQRAQMVDELRRQNREIARVSALNKQLYEAEKGIAEILQLSLVDLPPELPGVSFGHVYRSATRAAFVGGDFYEVFEAREGSIGVAIGDVAGHGVEAARVANLVKDTIAGFSQHWDEPSSVLTMVNGLLLQRGSPFVTALLGFLDPATGALRYACAGHPAGLLVAEDGTVRLLDSCGNPPLGVMEDGVFETRRDCLGPGDVLLLFTDGVTEARRNGDMFGERRLVQVVVDHRHLGVDGLPAALLDAVLEHSGGTLADDLAILAVGLKAPGREASRT